MSKRIFPVIILMAALALVFGSAQAADAKLMKSGVDIHDQASLQHGAKLFFNYCASCHSLNFVRYSRIAKDLDLSEDEVMDNFNFTGAKFRETIESSMPADGAGKWLGKAPPDLSLAAGERGADWIYSYLNAFYLDDDRPVGWNNLVFKNASMPNPLWELQGVQVAKGDVEEGEEIGELELAQAGRLTPSQYHQATRDISAFLTYVAEPAALQRHRYAPWVLLFLAVLSVLAWLLKREYWKDVHH